MHHVRWQRQSQQVSARKNDPTYGRNELVFSVLIGMRRIRHYVLETDAGLMLACRSVAVQPRDINVVKAHQVTCDRCRKYLNL